MGKYREKEEGQTALSTFAGCNEKRRESMKDKIGFPVSFKIIKYNVPAPKEKERRLIKCANCGEKLLNRIKMPFVRGLQFDAKSVLKEITFGEGFITSDRETCERVLKFARSSQTKEKERLFR